MFMLFEITAMLSTQSSQICYGSSLFDTIYKYNNRIYCVTKILYVKRLQYEYKGCSPQCSHQGITCLKICHFEEKIDLLEMKYLTIPYIR